MEKYLREAVNDALDGDAELAVIERSNMSRRHLPTGLSMHQEPFPVILISGAPNSKPNGQLFEHFNGIKTPCTVFRNVSSADPSRTKNEFIAYVMRILAQNQVGWFTEFHPKVGELCRKPMHGRIHDIHPAFHLRSIPKQLAICVSHVHIGK